MDILDSFFILIMISYVKCYGNDMCAVEFLYGHNGRTENVTCVYLDQMHVSRDVCANLQCTIKFLGENRILKTNSFSRMQNLEQLFLNDTKIAILEDEAFSGSPNIKLIHLERNEIVKIPRNIFSQLSSLEFLDLHGNRIEDTEGSFDGESLNYLDLSSNKLRNFPSTLLHSQGNLRTVNLSSNSLEYFFGDYIFNLENLILDHNKIESMIDCRFASEMETLSIAFNNLTTLDGPFFPSSLKYLNLSCNHIVTIKNKPFESLTQLIYLDISNNSLQNLPFGIFEDLGNLSYLDISSNHFMTLNDGVFSGLVSLKFLNLSGIELDELETRVFYSTPGIERMDISGNQLTNVDLRLLSRICKTLRYLRIEGNHFTCSDLAEILLNADEKNIQIPSGQTYERKNMKGIACFLEPEFDNNNKTPINFLEKTSTFNQSSLKNFYELVKIQNNLLRNISNEIKISKNIISNSMTSHENSRKMDGANELLQELIELNKELMELQKNQLKNYSSEMENTEKKILNNFMPGREISRKMDINNELLQKLLQTIESNGKLTEDKAISSSNMFTTGIYRNKAAFTAENSDMKNIIISLNDLRILLLICTLIMILFCVVKLLRQLKTTFFKNKYVLDTQELPFIERQNIQTV